MVAARVCTVHGQELDDVVCLIAAVHGRIVYAAGYPEGQALNPRISFGKSGT